MPSQLVSEPEKTLELAHSIALRVDTYSRQPGTLPQESERDILLFLADHHPNAQIKTIK